MSSIWHPNISVIIYTLFQKKLRVIAVFNSIIVQLAIVIQPVVIKLSYNVSRAIAAGLGAGQAKIHVCIIGINARIASILVTYVEIAVIIKYF